MKAYKIREIKNFMSILLGGGAFDCFLLANASITTGSTYTIDGRVVKEFFTRDVNGEGLLPPYEFAEWSAMRPLCFDLIKGRLTPVAFRFVLHLKPEMAEQILREGNSGLGAADVKALVLNIKYDGSMLTCITATALYTFLPDKTPDRLWDEYLSCFLTKNGIAWDEI